MLPDTSAAIMKSELLPVWWTPPLRRRGDPLEFHRTAEGGAKTGDENGRAVKWCPVRMPGTTHDYAPFCFYSASSGFLEAGFWKQKTRQPFELTG